MITPFLLFSVEKNVIKQFTSYNYVEQLQPFCVNTLMNKTFTEKNLPKIASR